MKKIITLILVVALTISATVFAEGIPSKTTGDLAQCIVKAENPGSENAVLYVAPSAAADKALGELIETGSITEYFKNAADANGNPVDLAAMLSADEAALSVDEFIGLFASGFEDDCGNVTATMSFATPFEADEKVSVMVGLVKNSGADWTAFEGTVVNNEELGQGCVQVVIPQNIVLGVQNGTGLLAVISK